MSSNRYNHYVPDPGHIPRMILALPWSHGDNSNNNAIFVRLLNANPKSSGSLSATGNITDGRNLFSLKRLSTFGF